MRDGRQWVRVYHYIMPSLQMRGTVEGYFSTKGHAPTIDGHIWVPIDDESVFVYNWMYSYDPSGPIPPEQALAQEIRLGRGPDDYVPGTFHLKASNANDYLIDRQAQKRRSFTGIKGVNTQDVALQEGMGPIVDRTKEHLGTTDRAIIVMRQLLMEATHDVEAGRMPRGVDPATYRTVRAVDRTIPADVNWKDAVKDDLYARF
jgi:phthalate 4,5-dioxygenase oxygenase subunit